MGPIRGYKKKRKIEKKIEQIDLASGSSEEGSVDWWDEFSKRIAGICFFSDSCWFNKSLLCLFSSASVR